MLNPRQVELEQSTRIFWVIQTVFALILARSLLEYKDCIVSPFTAKTYLRTLGLAAMYITVLWSWIDFSYTSIVAPYRFGKGWKERLRFGVDLLIVILYERLMFSLSPLEISNSSNLRPFATSMLAIFIFYMFSGILRRLQYGKRASRLWLIISFSAVFGVIALGYTLATEWNGPSEFANFLLLASSLAAMVVYRLLRTNAAYRKGWIGIDVDGVLADQIADLLPLISQRYDTELSHNDVVEWNLPINKTNIADIIHEQQKHRRYIVDMPEINGARNGVESIIKRHRIAVVTARPTNSDTWTQQWLEKHDIPYDMYVNLKEGKKQNADIDIDVLIDDYLGNIEEFLVHSKGSAILYRQPWNRADHHLNEYARSGRLSVAENWNDVVRLVEQILAQKTG